METESTIECNSTKRENDCRPEGPTPLPVATTSISWTVSETCDLQLNEVSYLLSLLVQEILPKLYLKKNMWIRTDINTLTNSRRSKVSSHFDFVCYLSCIMLSSFIVSFIFL